MSTGISFAANESDDSSSAVLAAAADESTGSIEVVDGDGNQVTITGDEIKSVTAVPVSADNPWTYTSGKNNAVKEAYGTFYSFKEVLSLAGIDYSDAHGLKAVARDGFVSGNTVEEIDNMYIYEMSEVYKDGQVAGDSGTFGLAINGSAGNRWGNDIVSISIAKNHVWFVKGGSCKHYCAICNEDEPTIKLIADDQEITLHDCEIKAVTAANVTADSPWTYTSGKNNTVKEAYGTFYSFKEVLSNAGIDYSDAHGLKAVARDGFTSGNTVEEIDNMYIYEMSEVYKDGTVAGEPGTYGLAINGSAGNRWGNDVVSISIAKDHVWFIKGGSCKHYCAICNEDEPSTTITVGSGDPTTAHDCELPAAIASAVASAEDGATVTLARGEGVAKDVNLAETLSLAADGKTVTLDLGDLVINGPETAINAASGNIILKNGTVHGQLAAADGATLKAQSGFYDYELPEANYVDGVFPAYDSQTKLYEVKVIDPAEAQKEANDLAKEVEGLNDTINTLTDTVNDLTDQVTTLTGEKDQAIADKEAAEKAQAAAEQKQKDAEKAQAAAEQKQKAAEAALAAAEKKQKEANANKSSSNASVSAVKVGKTVTVSGNTYAVTKVATSKARGTIEFTKAKNAKNITVPATISISGKIYNVASVGTKAFTASKIRKATIPSSVTTLKSGAFTGSKVKTLVVKSKSLTKASVKGSLTKSKVKTVKVKVGSKKVNKTYVKKYKKIFTKKNAGKKAKVKR